MATEDLDQRASGEGALQAEVRGRGRKPVPAEQRPEQVVGQEAGRWAAACLGAVVSCWGFESSRCRLLFTVLQTAEYLTCIVSLVLTS